MRHRQIEAFRAVMVSGTITGAARLLRTSQPSVSRLITDLERAVGLSLFERRHGRVSATPEALRLYEEVDRSFIGLERLSQFARAIRDLKGAQVTIGAMPALCLDLMPLALAEFVARHPGTRTALHARSSHQVVAMIISQQCELGLASPPFDLRGVGGHMLVSAPCVCVLPVGHPLCDRDQVTPADLSGEPMITVTSTVSWYHLEQAFQAARATMQIRIETPLSVVACRHVELGLGVAVVEPFTALYCAGRDLVVRPFAPAVPFVFGVLKPQSQLPSIAIRELVELLRAKLEALELPGGARPSLLPFTAQA